MMKIELAQRIKKLPPYLFAELDRMKAAAMAKGVDVIDLGVGDPDRPTPPHIIEALKQAAADPAHHRYPSYTGMNAFREAVSGFMEGRFSIKLDPTTEIVTLIGSKEGIANLPLAFVNPGDVVLVPSPGYPPTLSGSLFAGGTPHLMPLTRENGFIPDLSAIPESVADQAVMMHLNYPNNPTAALATREFYAEVIRFAKKHGVIIVSDLAYSELYYDEAPPISILQMPGGRDVAIEFHSLSKTYNMTGWRLGWACGNAELIAGLGKIKTNIDSGAFQAVQMAGIAALTGDQGCVTSMRKLYHERRQLLVEGLIKLGLDVASSAATFYVWVATPKGSNSRRFAARLLEEAGVVCTPGVGFGKHGEGFVRFALTREVARLQEALDRMRTKGL